MNAKTVFSTALLWTALGLGAARGQTTPGAPAQPPFAGSTGTLPALPPTAGSLNAPTTLPPGAPTSGPVEMGGASNGEYHLSSWILGDKYGCCDPVGKDGPIQTELFFYAGPSIVIGRNGQVSSFLQTGLDLEVGGRALFLNPAMDGAWDVELGVGNIYNHAHSGNPMQVKETVPQSSAVTGTTIPVQVFFGQNGVPGVTLQDLNRTTVDLGVGKDWWLWGTANSAGPKFRVGIDGGGSYGTERAEFHEIPHRTDVIAGLYAGVHADFECPLYGCFVFQAGIQIRYSYTWSDIMQIQNDSDVQDLNVLISVGLRF
jgi:hypothetical protein